MQAAGECATANQGEERAEAHAVAMGVQGPAHFFGGEGGGVEAKTVAILLGGEAVGEDAVEVFGGDADAVVLDLNLNLFVGWAPEWRRSRA